MKSMFCQSDDNNDKNNNDDVDDDNLPTFGLGHLVARCPLMMIIVMTLMMAINLLDYICSMQKLVIMIVAMIMMAISPFFLLPGLV